MRRPLGAAGRGRGGTPPPRAGSPWFLAPLAAAGLLWGHGAGASERWVLENERARVTLAPREGAAIVQYLDRRSGVEYSTAGARPPGPGLRDLTLGVDGVAHRLEGRDGAGYKGVVARATAPGTLQEGGRIVGLSASSRVAVEREMRLADGSTRLTVVLRYTNIGEEAVPLWIRWHPYLMLDDPYGEHSVIVAPGPGRGQMRRIRVGLGRDTHFLEVPGYWMAINPRTGHGVWMTFREGDAQVCATWTDYRRDKRPERGWFTVEPRRAKQLLGPGERVEMHLTYQPFAPGDRLHPGFVAPEERSAAQRFARLVRENAAVIAAHTMVPWPNEGHSAAAQNRFYFNNLRRDRFGLADAGIADALMAVPGVQSIPLRMRHYARLFDSCYDRTPVRFRMTVTDVLGRIVLREAWTYDLKPMETRTLDRRVELDLGDLEDGRYTFRLDVDLGEEEALHSYEEERVLAGRARGRAAEARRSAGSFAERERPFVTALRQVELPGGGRVPIGVEEAAGLTRVDWPMRVGVPFARGAFPEGGGIALSDALGRRLDTQTKVMGTWPDGSVRWLLVDFQSDVVGGGHAFLTLDPTDDRTRGAAMAGRRGDGVAVDVGTRVWVFGADGTIEGLLQPGDLWWRTGEGRTYRFSVAGPEAGVRIVENGPLRCRVRITGWYHPAKGEGDPVARGELDAEFYRGSPFFRLYHTWTYTGDPWEDTLGGAGIRFRPEGPFWKEAAVDLDGEEVSGDSLVVVRQLDDENAEAAAGRLSRQGSRSTGTVRMRRKERDLIIHHRDFWRLFPKRIEASVEEGTVTFHYWPEERGAMDWRPREDGMLTSSSAPTWSLAAGVSRTHEFIIDPAAWFELPLYERIFGEPVVCAVPPRYLTATGALMHLQPYDPEVCPDLEALVEEALESYLLNQRVYRWYGQWVWGSLPAAYVAGQGRWENHGRYGHLLNEQNIAHVPWLAFLRSGDRRWLRLASAHTRHLLEVGTIRHDPRDPSASGLSRRHHECIWLSPGDSGHSMVDPFLEMYHVTGYLPAWEASRRMARAMARPGAAFHDYGWRYLSNPIAGLARMYLETGEEAWRQEADRLWSTYARPDRNRWYAGGHGARMALWYGRINEEVRRLWIERTGAGEEDRAFHHLDALAALYEETGDLKYADAMVPVFDSYAAGARRRDPEREDPLRWGIAHATQHILAAVREMMYASRALAEARRK
ncbi:MAG: hypothetical protein OXG13_19860 [Gemmatimonadaceae bacterium]|nr:hypothetical protein [Gemmatimonadaceae bacterium]